MENSNLFYIDLVESNLNSFRDLLINFENINLQKLEDLNTFIRFGQKASADYLILDRNTSAQKLVTLLPNLKGSTLNTRLIYLKSDNDLFELFEAEELNTHFKEVVLFDLNNSALKKLTDLYDIFNKDKLKRHIKDDVLVPLPISYLSQIEKSSCDIYLKINENKFIKIISKDDDFKIKEIINNYSNKNVKEFFIPIKSMHKFQDHLLEHIFKFNPARDTKIQHQVKVAESAMAIAKDFGVSDFLLEGINDSFSDLNKEFNTNKKIKNFLDDLSKLNGTELGTHSYLTSIFVTVIGNKTPWFNKEIRKNLYLASIFHDLELLDTGLEEYEFKSIHEINKLTQKNSDFIKSHPSNLAKKLVKNESISSEVINIITKHHEGAGINSYPQKLAGSQLTPTICLFITAHEFSIQLKYFNYQNEFFSKIFGNIRQVLPDNNFKNYIDILENELSI